jgi:AcrR family transcriptional regulator
VAARNHGSKTDPGGFYLKLDWFKDAKTAFRKLVPEKQAKIIDACLDEFAEEGFETASTNRIAERAGIAKGSIFKYFGTKEKMFFSVVNYILEKYISAAKEKLPQMPKGVVERYMAYMTDTMDLFGGDMKLYRAFSRIMSERGGEMMTKIREQWQPYVEPLMDELLTGTDFKSLSITKAEFATLFSWIDNAIDQDVMAQIGPKTKAEDIKAMYSERLGLIYRVLKNGIYK